MGRKRVWPPKVVRHAASGQARCRYGGRDYYLGPAGSPEAQQAYARLLGELAAGGTPTPKRPAALTVAGVLDRWRQHAETRYGGSKEGAQFRFSLEPLLALYGDTPAAEFDALNLEAVQLAMATGSWMSAELKAKRGKRHATDWSARVVARRVVRIRTVWKWAEKHQLVPKGSYQHLRTADPLPQNDARVRRPPRRQAVPWDHVQAAAAKATRSPAGTMILLQWWTGMRPAEVRKLKPADIDRTGAAWVYRPPKHKMTHRGQDRFIVLGPRARALLEPLLRDVRPDAYLFRPFSRRATRDHYSDYGYAQVVRRACERAGVPPFESYQIRHAFKERVTREMGLDFARSSMGHSSLGTTAGYSSQIDLVSARQVAERLG